MLEVYKHGSERTHIPVKAAFHDTDTDILTRILARKLHVSDVRM